MFRLWAANARTMLSQRARYALRALIDLAEGHGGLPVPAGAIARQQSIPRKFLD